MVRLVFRPYTQIRRTICTSVSLRTSTRVSPGFILFRHRSPSFGSQRTCSNSNLAQALDRSVVPPAREQGSYLSHTKATFTFIPLQGINTQKLACTLDSLVRVSRRVTRFDFGRIANPSRSLTEPSTALSHRQNFVLPSTRHSRDPECHPRRGAGCRFLCQTQT